MTLPPLESAECDFCGRIYEWEYRFVNAVPRPSDPTEMVATLAICASCALIQPAFRTPDQWEDALESGEFPGVLFLDV